MFLLFCLWWNLWFQTGKQLHLIKVFIWNLDILYWQISLTYVISCISIFYGFLLDTLSVSILSLDFDFMIIDVSGFRNLWFQLLQAPKFTGPYASNVDSFQQPYHSEECQFYCSRCFFASCTFSSNAVYFSWKN